MRHRWTIRLVAALALIGLPAGVWSDDVYLTLEEAPAAIFPEATSIERRDVASDAAFRERVQSLIGRSKPTIWEPYYITFVAHKDGDLLGYAVVCEEIGKHRPITFITAVTPDGKVADVAVMMYREAYGGEVRYPAFTRQFRDKGLDDPVQAQKDIRHITGATLSSRSMARGVRKALAVIQLAYLQKESR